MIDQEKIHNQCLNEEPEERIKALNLLKKNFFSLPNRQQAWSDLHRLTTDEDKFVRYWAANTLGSVLYYMSDKRSLQLFWPKKLYRPVICYISGKQKVWNDLHRLTNDKESFVRSGAVFAFTSSFPYVPDKQQAWNDLHRLTADEDFVVRFATGIALSNNYSYLLNENRQQAWNDLIKLINDEDSLVRGQVIMHIGCAFPHAPDKQQAWNDLIKLINDDELIVWAGTVISSCHSYRYVPDKQQAWNDFIKIVNKEESNVRLGAIEVINCIFRHVPDKQQAWNDLLRLTNHEDSFVRYYVAYALGSAFSQVPDKQQAWEDLHRLTKDEDSDLRCRSASVIASIFTQLQDKQQAWNDLHRLKSDKEANVRAYANSSLGKVSIFKASQAENEEIFRNKLENAITFFKKAEQESPSKDSNPAQFCLPFYRSFYTIVFEKQGAKDEINKYIAEAKTAIESSKSKFEYSETKELLLEAIENLANALKEVQSLENIGFEAKKEELNFYRIYIDRASELMIIANEKAPHAIEVLRKGLPILDRNLNELLKEIQKKAKIACMESKGTVVEDVACVITIEVQRWEISSPEEMALYIEDLAYLLKNKIANIPEKEQVLGKIDLMVNEKDIAKKFQHLNYIIGSLPDQVYISAKNVITNPKNNNINISGDTYISGDTQTSEDMEKSPNFFMISKLILEHPIIATVVGGIIVVIIQKEYFP